jgi:hypothetical protein
MTMFDTYRQQAFPYWYSGQIHVGCIAGGTPSDAKTAEGWIRSKVQDTDDRIRALVASTMVEREVTAEEATKLVAEGQTLNGFKRDDNGLYIEGRHLKASLKEAVNVAANAGKLTTKGWGNPDNANYKKGLKAWFPEHVFVVEDRLPLGVEEPTAIVQRFVHGRYGSAIQYEEVVEGATIDFTICTDHEFTDEQWAMIWLTGEKQGIGASRSQGNGTYTVTRWERMPTTA